MYHLMSEIKKQQRMINEKIKRLLKLHEASYYGCSEQDRELMLELKRELIFLNKELRGILETHQNHQCWSDGEERCCCCHCKHPDPPQPPAPPVFAHGFAYTTVELSESGVVPLRIAGPLEEVELTSDGFVIAKPGVYQIQYSVFVRSTGEVVVPARFQLVVNDTVNITSSVTESVTSQQLFSNQLFSLLEGDVVKLVAKVPDGVSYSNASLQVLRVG